MVRTLVLTLLTIESLALSAPAPTVAATARIRAEIKSLPIEQRPNRPGHFYGNTVRRRLHSGR